MEPIAAFLFRLALFGLVAALSYWISTLSLDPVGNAACILGVLAIFPAVLLARALLDRQPAAGRAAWITTFLHAFILFCDAVALIKAWQTAPHWRLMTLPIPEALGTGLMAATGIAATLAVINLAVTGMGAPMALWLSRRLSMDWLYRYSRNPMALASILWFLAIGLWFQSAGFVLWVLLLAAPAELFFIVVYEERELEIRFGQPYLAYKAKTPFFWSLSPRSRPAEAGISRRHRRQGP